MHYYKNKTRGTRESRKNDIKCRLLEEALVSLSGWEAGGHAIESLSTRGIHTTSIHVESGKINEKNIRSGMYGD